MEQEEQRQQLPLLPLLLLLNVIAAGKQQWQQLPLLPQLFLLLVTLHGTIAAAAAAAAAAASLAPCKFKLEFKNRPVPFRKFLEFLNATFTCSSTSPGPPENPNKRTPITHAVLQDVSKDAFETSTWALVM